MFKVGTGVVALGLAAGLALAGCSSGGSGDPESSGSPTQLSPLDEYMQAMYSQPSDTDQKEQDRKYQEVIVRCMEEQGFEYKPSENSMVSYSSDDLGIDMSSREFAEQYGYGYSTNPFQDQSETPDANEEDPKEYVDPNAEYYDSLSDTAKAAYDKALNGAPMEAPEGSDPEEPVAVEYDWTKAGCSGVASHEVYETGGQGAWEDPKYESLMTAMQEMWEQVESDPRISEVDAKWSTCMSDAGFQFLNPMEANESIMERVNAFYADDPGRNGTASPEEMDAFWEDVQQRLKDEVTPDEIKTALADWDCKDSVGYEKARNEVRFKIEEEFIAQHKAELDQMVADYGVGKGK